MDDAVRQPADHMAFLAGGGEMGALMRAHDWSASALGPVGTWPQSLKVAVRLLLNTRHPMFIWWGPELIQFYNDAYRESLGPEKHPSALGSRGRDTWPEIWHLIGPQIDEVMAGGEATWHEDQLVPIVRHGGIQDVWWTYSFSPIDDEAAPNGVGGVMVICRETTAEVLSRRETDERYRALFNTVDAGFCVVEVDSDGSRGGAEGRTDYRVIEANSAFYQQTGFPEAILGQWLRKAAPALEEHWHQTYERVARTGTSLRFEQRSDHLGRWFDVHAVRLGEPKESRVAILFSDISERRAAEQAMRQSEARLRGVLEGMDEAFALLDRDYRILTFNQAALRMETRPLNEIVGRSHWEAYPGSEDDELGRLYRRALAEQLPATLEHRFSWEDGTTRWLETRAYPVPEGLAVFWRDISERKEREAALRESERRFHALAENVSQLAWMAEPNGHIFWYNKRWYDYTGTDFEAMEGWGWRDVHPPDQIDRVIAEVQANWVRGEPWEGIYHLRGKDGAFRPFLTRAEPIRDANGELVQWFGTNTDITAQVTAETKLRELNETLEQRVAEAVAERQVLADIVESSSAPTVALDLNYTILAINEANVAAFERAYGSRPKAGDNLLHLLAGMPESQAQVKATWSRALGGEEFVVVDTFGDAAHETAAFEIHFSVLRNREGRQIGATHTAFDISERVRAQAELEAAQEALRQSQKMEAMGSLTGGVAHDFNNLLTPIIASLDMLLRRGLGSERERRLMDGALQSAERAKTLVQRLLAFARRQPLQPGPVDVRRLVSGMADLIASTLGPRVDVRVNLPEDLPPAIADANQLEMAVLNLAVNARDAMPEGGVLTISAARESVRNPRHAAKLRPGHYVRLSVRDTGDGMDEATLARAVEPFFSTKGVGRGTGLGLSMVHGLASQLGGGLSIASSPGQGTTVDLWLPLSAVAVEEDDQSSSVVTAPQALGTALLVDDEDLVRMSTADMLMDLGYEVVEASTAEEALCLMDQGLAPNLVVTDHLMPGMSGLDLARDLRSRRPDLPVLIVSGYAEMDGIAPGFARLTKPFRTAELAESLAALSQTSVTKSREP